MITLFIIIIIVIEVFIQIWQLSFPKAETVADSLNSENDIVLF